MEDDEYTKLPCDERCVHKNWKARVSGYEEAAKLFRQIDDEKSPEFSKYLGLVRKFVIDSNAMGQEKGLEAALAFVENSAQAGKTTGEVMAGVVAKCIAAPKTRTRELALQLTLMYVEIEKGDIVVEELLKGMDLKNPKIVAGCVTACTQALRDFGSKVVAVKPVVKKLQTLFADRDKGVRDEARQLAVEIFRWIGAPLRSQLTNLQPVQITELEAEFAKIEGQKATPQRLTRSQQQRQIVHAVEAENGDGDKGDECEEDDDVQQLDPYDLADPVDILSKMPKDFYEKIEAKKWQERKEALEAVETLLKTPKLQNGDYGDLVRAVKKVIEKDSNVIVVTLATKCLGMLAQGLKKRFTVYAGACMPALLEKFKEKKQTVVAAVREAADAVYMTTTIEAIQEDVVEILGSKNPSVKSETALFLARAFTKTQPGIFNKKLLKVLTGALLKNLNEPDPTVRDSSADAVGTLMRLVGDKAVMPFLIELEKDNLKMSKIREYCDKAVITVKVPAAAAKKERATTAPSAAKSGSGASVSVPKSAPNTARSTSQVTGVKKAQPTAGKTKAAVKGGAKSTAAKPQAEREIGQDEADELAAQVLSNAAVLEELVNSNWKSRLAAAEQILSELRTTDPKSLPTQALIKQVTKKPGLKDTNFQVMKAKLDIVKYLAENGQFSTTSASLCVNDVVEKLADTKNSALAQETLTAIAESVSLPPVLTSCMEFATSQNNPKVIQEAFQWSGNAIKEFGFGGLNVKLLIDCVKKALGAANASIRQTAVTVCGVLYLYLGQDIYMLFENEKAALRDLINVECEKYTGEKPPQPIRGGLVRSKSEDLLSEDSGNADMDTMHVPAPSVSDLLPRVDISAQITEALLTELEDKNWKVRNEALTKVGAMIQEARLIKPSLGDLPQALAHRMVDSNMKLAQMAVTLCDSLAKAMGAPSRQYVRTFLPQILQCLGDNRAAMRQCARDTMATFQAQAGHKEFFESEMIADALKSGSPMLRIELWNWMAEELVKMAPRSVPREELLLCVPHLYSNLEDRNADVRKNAQEAVLGVMTHLGFETMLKQTEKLKPASKNGVVQALEKVRPYLPVKEVKSVPSSQEMKKPMSAKSKTMTKPKASTTTVNKPTPTSRKKEEDVDTSPLLSMNNMKHQRTIDESKLKVLKWNFTTPREEFVELLKEQMNSAHVNKTLISNMFHTDFRCHLKALESLSEDLSHNSAALIANLDLILKWLTLRFFDTNPSVLMKGLDYLQVVFAMLIDQKYNMLECEASAFLPYLVLKIGDPKDSVRNGVKYIIKQICSVYAVGKVFSYIMEGVKSKNARQRAECLETLGTIILDYGLSACIPSPAACFKELARHISDRDNSVRNAALNCVVQGYNIVGDKVYKMVGNISDKDLSLLEERIKRSSRRSMVLPPTKTPLDTISSTTVTMDRDYDLVGREGDGDITGGNGVAGGHDDDMDEDEANLPPVVAPVFHDTSRLHHQQQQADGPFALDEDLLRHLDEMVCPMAAPKLHKIDTSFLDAPIQIPAFINPKTALNTVPMATPTKSPQSPPNSTGSAANTSLRSNASNNINNNNKSPISSTANVDRQLQLNITMIGSADREIASQAMIRVMESMHVKKPKQGVALVQNEVMAAVVKQLKLLRHNDPRECVPVANAYRTIFSGIDSFYKFYGSDVSVEVIKELLNELIDILVEGKLEQCPQGGNFVRVINVHCVKIIEKSDHTRIICALTQLLHECVRTDATPRHTELVMKCLWRVIKLMPGWDIDLDTVLLDIHVFLKEYPSTWWRSQPVDTPLRTVKTILHSCVKTKGGAIMMHFGKIPNKNESEVEAYVLKLLKTLRLEPQRPSLSKATHSMLTEIFQKIGQKDETKEGLTLLYDFMQQHPEADIEPFLKKSAKFFQDYIQNGLKEIECSRGKTTSEKIVEKVYESIKPTLQAPPPPTQEDEEKDVEYWKNRLSKWQNIAITKTD